MASAAATEVANLHQSAQAEWQDDYDRALKQEKSGKVKMYVGLGVLTLGLTVGVRMSSSPDSGSAGTATAILLDAGGGLLTFWGVREYLNARSDLAPAGVQQARSRNGGKRSDSQITSPSGWEPIGFPTL